MKPSFSFVVSNPHPKRKLRLPVPSLHLPHTAVSHLISQSAFAQPFGQPVSTVVKKVGFYLNSGSDAY